VCFAAAKIDLPRRQVER
jgi:transposase-like protein